MHSVSVKRDTDVWAYHALLLFGIVVYAVPGEWLTWARPLRLALLSSSLAAALFVLRRLGQGQPISLDGLRGSSLLGFTAVCLASSAWSIHPEVSRTTAFELLKLTAIYFTLVNVVSSFKRLKIFISTLVLASMVTSIGVINWHRAGIDLVEGFRSRWVGVYADPNHMAMDVGLVVPLALALIARVQTPLWLRICSALSAGLAVVAIVLSHSRGGFLGLAIACAIWALREKRKLQAMVLGLFLVVGLAVFAPETFWRRTETVTSFQEDASAMGRVYAWEVTAGISKAQPMLGVGAGAFRFAWPLYAPPEAQRAYVAHNVFLDVIGELGLIGLFLFLIFVSSSWAGALKASRHAEYGWLCRAISASIAGYLVCDLFSGYILSSHLYVLFGLGACCERLAQSPKASVSA